SFTHFESRDRIGVVSELLQRRRHRRRQHFDRRWRPCWLQSEERPQPRHDGGPERDMPTAEVPACFRTHLLRSIFAVHVGQTILGPSLGTLYVIMQDAANGSPHARRDDWK